MSDFSATIQSADWKVEKHAPSIEAPETVKAGETFTAVSYTHLDVYKRQREVQE